MELKFISDWSFGYKLSFRYLFVFFSLIIFPFPLNIIPGMETITGYYDQLWTFLINVVGKNFLGIEQPLRLEFTGSGDRLYDWVWYFCVILLTLLLGTVFFLLDRKRDNYQRLKS